MSYGVCPPGSAYEGGCATLVFFDVLNSIIANDWSSCTKMIYEGVELDYSQIKGFPTLISPHDGDYLVFSDSNWDGKPTILFSYKYDSPEVMEIQQQFIIMEFVDLIGVVGGTLGLFVGFSFLGFAFQILDYLIVIVKKLRMLYLEKMTKKVKKTSKVGSEMNKTLPCQQLQPQVNTAQVNTVQVNTDQVNTVQVNTDQVNTDQVNIDQVNTDQVNTNQVTPAQEVDST